MTDLLQLMILLEPVDHASGFDELMRRDILKTKAVEALPDLIELAFATLDYFEIPPLDGGSCAIRLRAAMAKMKVSRAPDGALIEPYDPKVFSDPMPTLVAVCNLIGRYTCGSPTPDELLIVLESHLQRLFLLECEKSKQKSEQQNGSS